MKYCSVCGGQNPDDARFCSACGIALPSFEGAESATSASPNNTQSNPTAQKPASRTESDGMAIAGFVLSLLGVLVSGSLLLQVAALILSVAGKSERYRGLRISGIVISGISLAISLLLWALLLIFAPTILNSILQLMIEFG